MDEALFELEMEMERIFTRAWVFVGLESEIPNPGDYVTRSLGLDPVILVRDQHGRVQVFHNSCPHRGAMICIEAVMAHDGIRVASQVLLLRVRANNPQPFLLSAAREDLLRPADGGLLLARREVQLDMPIIDAPNLASFL